MRRIGKNNIHMSRLLGDLNVEHCRPLRFPVPHNALSNRGEVGVRSSKGMDGGKGVFVGCSRRKEGAYHLI